MDDRDLRELANPAVSDVPWYFRLGRYMSRHRIRGGDRLVIEARKRGLLDRLVSYPLGNDVRLHVPLWRPCNSWDELDVQSYEAAFIRGLSATVCQLGQGVTFVDCGADIGTVSAHIVARCPNVSSVIAFEPNRAAYTVLAQNLSSLRIHGVARNVAVGDFTGRGILVTPDNDSSAHAAFMVPSPDGTICVQRVDDLHLSPDEPCAIKIDVEGGANATSSMVPNARSRKQAICWSRSRHIRRSRREQTETPSKSCRRCFRPAVTSRSKSIRGPLARSLPIGRSSSNYHRAASTMCSPARLFTDTSCGRSMIRGQRGRSQCRLLGARTRRCQRPPRFAQNAQTTGSSSCEPKSVRTLQYWAANASEHGALAVKYSAQPCAGAPAPAAVTGDSFLRADLKPQLAAGTVCFDVFAQKQLDSVAQSVEDGTSEWDPAQSPPVRIARLTIPQTALDTTATDAIEVTCNHLSFNPWNSAPDYRPLGHMNRSRKYAYEASTKMRNAAPEPTTIPGRSL